MTWSGDSTYGLPEPEGKPPLDEVSKAVLAGVAVIGAICLVIVISMMTGGGGDKAQVVAAPVAPPPVPEPIPTVTVTATPEPAPTVYVTQAPVQPPPPPVQQIPQTVPLEQVEPSENDQRRQRSLCYDALSSNANLPPQARWTAPCQTAFPHVDPGRFMFREQPFAQRLAFADPRWRRYPPNELAKLGWTVCSTSQDNPDLDRSAIAERAGSGSTGRLSTGDFLVITNAAFDALCPEAENKISTGGGYGPSGTGPRYGA